MPNADKAFIEPKKLTHYLLNLDHKAGHPKAAAFLRAGYHPEAPELLRVAICNHATLPVVERIEEFYGARFVIEGFLRSSLDTIQVIFVRTVWEIRGDLPPRLITAYPVSYATPF